MTSGHTFTTISGAGAGAGDNAAEPEEKYAAICHRVKLTISNALLQSQKNYPQLRSKADEPQVSVLHPTPEFIPGFYQLPIQSINLRPIRPYSLHLPNVQSTPPTFFSVPLAPTAFYS